MNPIPQKTDINPATGKAFAVNPQSGAFDDNYWANTVEPQLKAQYGTGSQTATPLSFNQPTIDLPGLYSSLTASSGVGGVERQLVDTQDKANATISTIKNNPYLSEGTMSGRISKVTDKSNADIANLKNDIAMRKADVETQLNLQTKQFDINSQQATQAFDQFKSLLGAGALDNATGADIANLTRSTGLSSSMIQSAIDANKANTKNKVTIEKVDDGNNVYAISLDSKGNVVNRQLLGASTPTAAEVKATLGGGGGTTSSAKQIAADKAAAPASAISDAKNKMTLGTMMNLYQQYGMTPQQIYDIYVRNAPTSYKANSTSSIAHDTALYHVKHN